MHWASEWLYAFGIIALLTLGGCAAIEAGKVVNAAVCNNKAGC